MAVIRYQNGDGWTDALHNVGDFFLSANNTSPADKFGGTWTDVTALGVGSQNITNLDTDLNILQSQTWSDITVQAKYRSGIVSVTIDRWGASGTAFIPHGESNASVVGQIKSSFAPSRNTRQFVGWNGNGVWVFAGVDTRGRVLMWCEYDPNNIGVSIASFSTVLTYVKPTVPSQDKVHVWKKTA